MHFNMFFIVARSGTYGTKSSQKDNQKRILFQNTQKWNFKGEFIYYKYFWLLISNYILLFLLNVTLTWRTLYIFLKILSKTNTDYAPDYIKIACCDCHCFHCDTSLGATRLLLLEYLTPGKPITSLFLSGVKSVATLIKSSLQT